MIRMTLAAVVIVTAISFLVPVSMSGFNTVAEAQEAQKKKKHKNTTMGDPRKGNRK